MCKLDNLIDILGINTNTQTSPRKLHQETESRFRSIEDIQRHTVRNSRDRKGHGTGLDKHIMRQTTKQNYMV